MSYVIPCTYKQAVVLKQIGFNELCRCHYEDTLIGIQLFEGISPRNYNNCGTTFFSAPTLHHIAKWFREELGVDIVISPKFDSSSGDCIGYFWRWSQRTDVNMYPKIHKSYEAALSDAISTVLDQFKGISNLQKEGGE